MKSGKRSKPPPVKFLKRRNDLVRRVLSEIEDLTEKLAKTKNAEQKIRIRARLKQLRMTQKSLSVPADDPPSSVRLPRSYVKARAERIEAARRISKRGYVQFVQGGAPGSGNKR
jgi:hypothetical protein